MAKSIKKLNYLNMDKIRLRQIIREEINKTLNEKYGLNNMEDDDVLISPEMNLGIISIPEN